MTETEVEVFWLLVRPWIVGLAGRYASQSRPVGAFVFQLLPAYFSGPLLAQTKVVLVERVPLPPLKAMGLGKFKAFEQLAFPAITYQNTYYLRRDYERNEAAHFHELVHVLQWRSLGPEGFLKAYISGLEGLDYRPGNYRRAPLELMACDLQARFEEKTDAFDVETEVAAQLAKAP